MARKTEEDHKPEVLIGIVERYYAEKDPVRRPKYSELGKYARDLGKEIEDHIFRRSPEVREYLDRMDASKDDELRVSVAVYDTLDTGRFLSVNNTPAKLKKALQERDTYYRQVTVSAGKIFEKNKELVKELSHLKEKNRALTTENKSLDEKIKELINIQHELEGKNKKLRGIIDTWVYPEVANELLKKEGLLKDTADVVKDEAVENEVLDGSSDIGGLIKSMFTMVGED